MEVIITHIPKPDDCRYQPDKTSKIVRKIRGDMAATYRRMRRDNPAVARLVWKLGQRFEQRVVKFIMSGGAR